MATENTRSDAARTAMLAREIAGQSLRQLAVRTGIDHSALCRLERGVHDPRIGTFGRVLHATGYRLVAVPVDSEIVPLRGTSCSLARVELITYPFPDDWCVFSGRDGAKS